MVSTPEDAAPSLPSTTILGFRVFTFESADQLIDEVVGRNHVLVALNAEKLARGDERVQAITNSGVGYADGYGAVLALRRKGLRTARIAGVDLWLRVIERTAGRRRIFLVGASDDVMERAVAKLRVRFPTLQLVGYRNGFLGPGELAQLARHLSDVRPDIVFVAMGSPRQELVMSELRKALPALYVGLGGSLDVYVGLRRRAPPWMQRIGLEWAFRFLVDPSRLPRLPAYGRFAWLLLSGHI